MRKQAHNQRRRKPAPLKETEKAPEPGPQVRPPWPQPLIEHLRIVVSLIEERPVSREEILRVLEKVLRQHRMARVRRIDHIIDHLNQHPP